MVAREGDMSNMQKSRSWLIDEIGVGNDSTPLLLLHQCYHTEGACPDIIYRDCFVFFFWFCSNS
jgi:hypothetical protein